MVPAAVSRTPIPRVKASIHRFCCSGFSICALGIMPRNLLWEESRRTPFNLQCAFLFSFEISFIKAYDIQQGDPILRAHFCCALRTVFPCGQPTQRRHRACPPCHPSVYCACQDSMVIREGSGVGNLGPGLGSSYMKYVVNIYTTDTLNVLCTVEDIEA